MSTQAEQQWSDLPPELLAAVSDRLHDVADFIRFHAVCKPWRDSLPPATSEARRHTFFPWLIDAPSGRPSVVRLRSVFSRRGYYTKPGRFATRSWVTHADGTVPWFFPARLDGLENTLANPLTGDTTTVPPHFYHGAVVYGDGTLFLYSRGNTYQDDKPAWFGASILRPGATAWTSVDAEFKEDIGYDSYGRSFATYRVYDGKVIVCVAEDSDRAHDIWHLLAPAPSPSPPVGGVC